MNSLKDYLDDLTSEVVRLLEEGEDFETNEEFEDIRQDLVWEYEYKIKKLLGK